MKSVMRQLVFGIAFVAVPSAVFGQTYCPQALMGQMNGSYYYNCQICTACTNTHLASNSAYDCGGCCTDCGCGTQCAEIIEALIAPSPTLAEQGDLENKRDNGDDKFDVLCVHDRQTQFADFSSKTGFKSPGSHVKVTRFKVLVNIPNEGDFYFHCIEAVHKDYPNMPLRIGQELDGDTPIPASMNIQTITAARTKGTGHYHRLKAGNRHFDVLSVNDLGNQ